MRLAAMALGLLFLLSSTLVPASLTMAATNQPVSEAAAAPAPVTAAQAVAIGTYRPQFPNDLSSMVGYEQSSGRKLNIVSWYALWGGWKKDFSRADLDIVSNRGSVPLITWEPWSGTGNDPAWTLRGAILSGQNDAYIDSWARGMAAYGKPVLLRFAHEMHNQTYPWALGVNGNTAAEYVAAWKYVRAIFARYNTSNVQWVWNPNTMGDTLASTYDPIYRSLYPGDDQVDWIGLDIYNTGPKLDWGAAYWRTFTQSLAQPYAAITAISSKPLLLGEVGAPETGGDKPAWVTSALTTELLANFPRVRAFVWFDITKEENWTVESTTGTRAAWVGALQNAVFAIDATHPIWGQPAGAPAPASPTPSPTPSPTATNTSVPPTATATSTQVPATPTNTQVPATPTATAVPPTNTPTASPIPPTATPSPSPTAGTRWVTLPVVDGWDNKTWKMLSQEGGVAPVLASDSSRWDVPAGSYNAYWFSQGKVPAGAKIQSVKVSILHYEDDKISNNAITWQVGNGPLDSFTVLASRLAPILKSASREGWTEWDVTSAVNTIDKLNALTLKVRNDATNGRVTKLNQIYVTVGYQA